MVAEQFDCVVLGGGPAGSTFASIVRKYAPDARVVVLEKDRFPRWHIGESTIPVANGVFKDLGVYETLLASSFVKKVGVTFIWGQDRQPWNADYLSLAGTAGRGDASQILDVTGQDYSALVTDGGVQKTPFSAFNVRRAELDKLLLDNSRSLGADVREGTRATAVLKDEAGRVCGVSWEDDEGRTGRISAPFVMDACGLASMLTRGQREHCDTLNNFAVHGYLSGAKWKVMYSGRKDYTTVFIAAIEKGWIWYFPIDDDLITVGVVTNTRHFQDRLKDIDLEAFFWEGLRSCPELTDLVQEARLREDILPRGARVAACRDWSSWAREPVGPGWAAAGDAAMFVDPILSTGVTLALQTGHRAAYTFLTARSRPDLEEGALWRAYADYLRGEYGSFLQLARVFYGNNKAAPSWWWEAQQLVNASGKLDISDRQAFTMATAGFFPVPRALGPGAETVLPIIKHITGTKGDVHGIYHETGVPEADEMMGYGYEVLTPFRLDLRTEPGLEWGKQGALEIYHDLIPESLGFFHRLAASPARIPPVFAGLVAAVARGSAVDELLEQAPTLAPTVAPEAARAAALQVIRVAAMKGFLRLSPPVPTHADAGAQAPTWP